MTTQTHSHAVPGGAALAAFVAAAAAVLSAAALPAVAADETAAPQTIVLKAAHLFDSTGTALKDSGTIVVRGDRIVSVGGTAPAGARVIDLGDATLLPGFIDAHTHLTLEFEKDYYHFVYNRIMRFRPSRPSTAHSTRDAPSKRASPPCATSGHRTSWISACATRSTRE